MISFSARQITVDFLKMRNFNYLYDNLRLNGLHVKF